MTATVRVKMFVYLADTEKPQPLLLPIFHTTLVQANSTHTNSLLPKTVATPYNNQGRHYTLQLSFLFPKTQSMGYQGHSQADLNQLKPSLTNANPFSNRTKPQGSTQSVNSLGAETFYFLFSPPDIPA